MEYNGIVYDSTKFKGGINYAIYAKPKAYPPSKDESYRSKLMESFNHGKPLEIIKKI